MAFSAAAELKSNRLVVSENSKVSQFMKKGAMYMKIALVAGVVLLGFGVTNAAVAAEKKKDIHLEADVRAQTGSDRQP